MATLAKNKSQVQKFRDTARQLDANESEEDFNASLKKVAKAAPPPPKTSKAKPKRG
jgi:hypothetical protein